MLQFQDMKRQTWLILAALVLVVVPIFAYAQQGLVPCSGAPGDECQLCSAVQMMNLITDWLVGILSIVAAIMIAYSGLKLVTSGGNSGAKEESKTMITNVVIGFVIVLAAWLLIDLMIRALTPNSFDAGLPWQSIQCVPQPQSVLRVNPIDGTAGQAQSQTVACATADCAAEIANCSGIPVINPNGDGTASLTCNFGGGELRLPCDGTDCTAAELRCEDGGGTAQVDQTDPVVYEVICTVPTGGGAAGSCEEPTSGACAASNLSIFGARASEASQICNMESGGTPVTSGSDLCCGNDATCANGQSFSGGYFQINILANANLIPGCNSSFFNRNGSDSIQGNCVRRSDRVFQASGLGVCLGWSCQITDPSMYLTCIQATRDRDVNFQAAQNLYERSGFQPWEVSAGRCGVPL